MTDQLTPEDAERAIRMIIGSARDYATAAGVIDDVDRADIAAAKAGLDYLLALARQGQGAREGGPWRVMTPEEYAGLVLKGPHTVDKDWDGFGNVAVWMGSTPPRPAVDPGVVERVTRFAAFIGEEVAPAPYPGTKHGDQVCAADLRALLSAVSGGGLEAGSVSQSEPSSATAGSAKLEGDR